MTHQLFNINYINLYQFISIFNINYINYLKVLLHSYTNCRCLAICCNIDLFEASFTFTFKWCTTITRVAITFGIIVRGHRYHNYRSCRKQKLCKVKRRKVKYIENLAFAAFWQCRGDSSVQCCNIMIYLYLIPVYVMIYM